LADPDKQLNVVNTRCMTVLAPDAARHPLAGDQLHVDLDLSEANLPVGTQLMIGTAVIEVTAPPHRGCAKFADRFGADAVRWVNSPVGVELRLRGINARVVHGGTIHRGDTITKVTGSIR
jgi:MOSC domain-containing protein YiiM